MKEKDQGFTSATSPQEVMSARHKKKRPRCYFVINLGINSKTIICMTKKRS